MGELGQRLFIAVHLAEVGGDVLPGAAGLDRVVGAGLGAEAAVHANAEIDLVAVDVEGAVLAGRGGDQDAAIGAGLGAGRAASAALLEPDQVRAGAGRDGPDLFGVLDRERGLENVIESAGVGEFDGNDMAADGSNGTIFMYGPNADNLFDTVLPVLESTSFMIGAKATLRYGPPEDGVSEISRTVGT